MPTPEKYLVLLPRATATGLAARSLLLALRIFGASVLLLTTVLVLVAFPGAIDTASRLALAGVLLAMVVLMGLAQFSRRYLTSAVLLVAAIALDVLFLTVAFESIPAGSVAGIYLANRLGIALPLFGGPARRPLPALAWAAVGIAAAACVLGAQQAARGFPIDLGAGLWISAVTTTTLLVVFHLVERAQQRRVPDFPRHAREVQRIDRRRAADARAVALVHDTILGDLALVMNGPDVLDARARARLLDDLALLAASVKPAVPAPTGLTASSPAGSSQASGESSDAARTAGDPASPSAGQPGADLEAALLAVITTARWAGLTVNFSGSAGGRMSPAAVQAAAGALGAALDNVRAHAGVLTADVALGLAPGVTTIMVVDAGTGFDPTAVPVTRLGLRVSIAERLAAVGGSSRVFSSPGAGTSILLVVPQVDERAGDGGGADGEVPGDGAARASVDLGDRASDDSVGAVHQ